MLDLDQAIVSLLSFKFMSELDFFHVCLNLECLF